MELLGSTLRQRLSYGACAIAVVCTLSVYKSSIGTNSLSTEQRHGEAKDATISIGVNLSPKAVREAFLKGSLGLPKPSPPVRTNLLPG